MPSRPWARTAVAAWNAWSWAAEMVLRQASCSVLVVKKPLVEAEAVERRPVASALPAT